MKERPGRTWGSSVFPGRQTRPGPKGPSVPQMLAFPTCAHANKFCMVIKLDVRQNFTRRTTSADARSVCTSEHSCINRFKETGNCAQ